VRKEGCSESGERCKESLSRLLRKYHTLLTLRSRRDVVEAAGADWSEAEGADRREAFRRLAEEFPGALRELELPAEVLAARVAEVSEELARGGAVERTWVRVAIGFHERLAAALAAKGWLARRIGPRGTVTDEVIEAMAAFLGRGVSREEAEALHHPPGGRVVDLVWRELEAEEGLPRDTLREMLFGLRA
jgi:hypothetical protein